MIGTFRVTKYADRRAYLARRPFDVQVSTNQFTDAGLRWLWDMAFGNLRNADGGITDQLQSARIVVGDGVKPFEGTDRRMAGAQTAQVDCSTGFPVVVGIVQEGDQQVCRAQFQGVFGERDAIFDWQERGVVTAQGVLLDRAVGDNGRKVLGNVWTVQVSLDLTR